MRADTPPPTGSLPDEEGSVWLLEDSLIEAEGARRGMPGQLVLVFTDGAALLEALDRAGAPDVLVLDWELPALSGIEVCRFVRRKHDRLTLPIIMLTSHRDEASIIEAFDAGANDYIVKPYAAAELAARVRAAVRTRRLHGALLEAHASLEHEQALVAESEAKYRRLSQSGVIGIIEADLAGRVIDANDTFLRMIGRTRRDMLSGRLAAPDCSPLDDRSLRELLENGVTSPYEKELVHADGGLVIVKIAAARLGPRAERCVGYVLDVTNERQVEADRARLFDAERRARADAELASRMKDEFLAIVSHELRTPMNAVLGWASILQSRLPPSDESTKALEVIQRNARLQAKMIDDILDVSRIVTGKVRLEPREVALESIIEQALEATRPAAEAKGITIAKNLAPDLPLVVVDPDRIQQIVWNLLTNAVKFTDRGGDVFINARLEHSRVVVEITDSGVGIAPEHLVTVFERFRQIDASTTRSHGGLGLGLAIVRHLAEQHGGTVRAFSDGPGRGTTMTVRLPLVAPLSAPTPEPPVLDARPLAAGSSGPIPSLAGTTVVVLDDDADSLAFASAALRNAGARTLECSTVDDAIATVRAQRPDVVVSDIAMPGQDGYAFIARLRALSVEEGGHTPSIALTAHAREDDVARCLSAGFERHLAKPLEAADLVRCVHSCR
jgi:PAS domain S-box-containing protein